MISNEAIFGDRGMCVLFLRSQRETSPSEN